MGHMVKANPDQLTVQVPPVSSFELQRLLRGGQDRCPPLYWTGQSTEALRDKLTYSRLQTANK